MKSISKAYFPAVRIFVFLASVIFGTPFSKAVVVVPAGGLTVVPSGNDLVLSFATTSPKYYTLQTSSNLQQWANYLPGLAGDGTQKSVTMTNATLGTQTFYRFVAQTPTTLVLPQSMAFAILGYSCGGIKEQVSAGIDVTNGCITGIVNLSTSCSTGGRGGHSVTHTAAAVVTWDFGGNVISSTSTASGATVNPTVPADTAGDAVYNVGSVAYLVVPIPTAPTGVTAVQSGDQFQVSWTPSGVNPVSVTTSTVTAAPVNSTAPVLTVTVSGSATSGVIPTLQPQTTYQITVVTTTIGGSSPASAPINVTTSPATVLPSAPAVVTASWVNSDPSGTTDTLVAGWQTADPGNSPIDEYLITITGSDGGGTYTQTVSGTTLSASFNVNFTPNWSVTVQAHNAAGWGPVSSAYKLGGL